MGGSHVAAKLAMLRKARYWLIANIISDEVDEFRVLSSADWPMDAEISPLLVSRSAAVTGGPIPPSATPAKESGDLNQGKEAGVGLW